MVSPPWPVLAAALHLAHQGSEIVSMEAIRKSPDKLVQRWANRRAQGNPQGAARAERPGGRTAAYPPVYRAFYDLRDVKVSDAKRQVASASTSSPRCTG